MDRRSAMHGSGEDRNMPFDILYSVNLCIALFVNMDRSFSYFDSTMFVNKIAFHSPMSRTHRCTKMNSLFQPKRTVIQVLKRLKILKSFLLNVQMFAIPLSIRSLISEGIFLKNHEINSDEKSSGGA